MSNAFAPIVRARPNPIFGRPVHQGSPPIDYSPILLLKPFGFRIAPDTLSSDENLVGQRGITPAFGYSAPHPSAGGTLTLLIHALPSAHNGLFRLYPGTDVSQIQHLRHLCTRGIYKAPIEGGVLVDPRVGALVLGQDLRAGYIVQDGVHYQLYLTESI